MRGRRAGRPHDILIIGKGRRTYRRDEFAVCGILDGDLRAMGRVRPADGSRPGAGMDLVDLESREQGLYVHRRHRAAAGARRRWRPALPVTTTSAERSFVPPCA